MTRNVHLLLGAIFAVCLSCSQQTLQPKASGIETSQPDTVAPPTSAQKTVHSSGGAQLEELRKKERVLAGRVRANDERLRNLEQITPDDRSRIDQSLRTYFKNGQSLSALRAKIAQLEVNIPELKEGISTQDAETRLLALTASVTEVGVDLLGKKMEYEALLEHPQSPGQELRRARNSYLNTMEMLWSLEEQLAAAREAQRQRDVQFAEWKRQNEKRQKP